MLCLQVEIIIARVAHTIIPVCAASYQARDFFGILCEVRNALLAVDQELLGAGDDGSQTL